MLPQHLIVEFWDTVKADLIGRFGLTEDGAGRAICEYKSLMNGHQALDMIYHRNPESVAETIAGLHATVGHRDIR